METGWPSELHCSESQLRWLDAWCATPQRPLQRLQLQLSPGPNSVIAPDVAAGLVAVLCRSSTSLQHLDMWYSDSLGEQLVQGEGAQESGFLAALAALQQLTSLEINNCGTPGCVLPSSTVLPNSLQRLVYQCGELPRQVSQLTQLQHLSANSLLPASLALLPSLRGLRLKCEEVPAQLAQLTQLEDLDLPTLSLWSETIQHVTALTRLTRASVVWLRALAAAAYSDDLIAVPCPRSSHPCRSD